MPPPAMNILSIQSQVVAGHVGNAAAVPALQQLGFEVWAVPTVLLAHHPGHGRPPGRRLPATEIAALVEGLAGRRLLTACAGVLTGYLGEPEHGPVVGAAIARVRRDSPAVLVCCDPVLGDSHSGLYVPAAVAQTMRDTVLPAADLATPNQFELEWLTGRPVGSLADAIAACRQLARSGPRIVVCTSLRPHGGAADRLATLAVTDAAAWVVRTPLLPAVPHGSGDLLAALLLGRRLQGRPLADALSDAVSACYAVLAASVGAPELRLIETRRQLTDPDQRFAAEPAA